MHLSRGVRLIDVHSSSEILCNFDYYLIVVICGAETRYNMTVMEIFSDTMSLMKAAKFINRTV